MRMYRILEWAYRSGVPVLFWGEPGVGKTAAIHAFARRMGAPIATILPSIRERTDYAGLPTFTETRDAVRFVPPEWPKRLVEAVERTRRRAIVFLDEINTTPPSDQPPLMALALERRVGDFRLPPDTAVFAAANPPELAAAGWDLSPPLANRFIHIRWSTNAEAWYEEFPSYWGSPPRLPEVPEDVWSRVRALVAGFIRVRPDLLLQVPQDPSARGGAWPSPRSWDHASRALAAVVASGGSVADGAPFVTGAVGDGAGTEFLKWVKELDLPDPDAVLADPDGFRVPRRGDHAYAVLAAVAARACGDDEKRWRTAWRVMARAHDQGVPDIAAAAARRLARARKPNWQVPPEAAKLLDVLRDAHGGLE